MLSTVSCGLRLASIRFLPRLASSSTSSSLHFPSNRHFHSSGIWLSSSNKATPSKALSTKEWCQKHGPKIPEEDKKNIVESIYTDVELPEMNLADFVWLNVDSWKDNVALVSPTFIKPVLNACISRKYE